MLVLDNASFHKAESTRKIVQEHKCEMLFLPPYSPDLNPIEKYWANMKTKIRELLTNVSSLEKAMDLAILSM